MDSDDFRYLPSPEHLNFTCVLAGVEPVRLDREFTCLELACDQQPTLAEAVARNPNARFYVAEVDARIAAGAAALPPMDFIILRGAYSWLDRKERHHYVELCKHYLKPGGVAYVSYNALPGCSSVLPLQRLVREQGKLRGDGPAQQLAHAALLAGQLRSAGAAYFEDNDTHAMRCQLNAIAQGGTAAPHPMHEFMRPGWEALHHADVARAMSEAKLDYVASADMSVSDPDRGLTPAQRALIEAQAMPALRETVRDILLDTAFRRDVYVRGARRMHPLRREELLGASRFRLSA